jgi:hypothetical protein
MLIMGDTYVSLFLLYLIKFSQFQPGLPSFSMASTSAAGGFLEDYE